MNQPEGILPNLNIACSLAVGRERERERWAELTGTYWHCIAMQTEVQYLVNRYAGKRPTDAAPL